MHNTILVYWIVFAVLVTIIVICDLKFNLLRDSGPAAERSYSWARVQLAWWMLIVLSSMIMIIICSAGNQIPTLDTSTLILLGITTGTTAAARIIDTSNQNKPNVSPPSNQKENFFLDILSDDSGVNIHRLQTVIFNFVFGVWFIHYVLSNYADPCTALHLVAPNASLPTAGDNECATKPWNYIMPVISQNNLILLGLSSATYAALKATEPTKTPTA